MSKSLPTLLWNEKCTRITFMIFISLTACEVKNCLVIIYIYHANKTGIQDHIIVHKIHIQHIYIFIPLHRHTRGKHCIFIVVGLVASWFAKKHDQHENHARARWQETRNIQALTQFAKEKLLVSIPCTIIAYWQASRHLMVSATLANPHSTSRHCTR
jgi:hypothetical protein